MKEYRTVEYYFIKEYQWNNKWFSKTGICKAKVYASHEFLQNHPFVDFNIFGDWFVLTNKMRKIESAKEILNEIIVKLSQNETYYLGNEISGIKIEKERTFAYDNLGTKDGIEGPICWNIKTPKEYQNIPTLEMLDIMKSWIQFLEEQTQIELKEKSI